MQHITTVLSVTKAVETIYDMDHEYSPIIGIPEFNAAAAELAFGKDSEVLKNKLVSAEHRNSVLFSFLTFYLNKSLALVEYEFLETEKKPIFYTFCTFLQVYYMGPKVHITLFIFSFDLSQAEQEVQAFNVMLYTFSSECHFSIYIWNWSTESCS